MGYNNEKEKEDAFMKEFPRTTVAGVSLPRMLIGTNWVLGYSHRSPAADQMIRTRYESREAVAALMEAYLTYGINAVMAPFVNNQVLLDGIHLAEDRTGKKMILISTPGIDTDDSAEGRKSAMDTIKGCRAVGADFCLLHHGSVEKLVNKGKRTIERLPDYLDMVRQCGMIPGLSAHMPELVLFSDENGYDVETYIQIYNCMGFLMQVEIEYIRRVIENAKKPVMTIKSMAAGRCTPYVGITFSFATLRPCDMVTVGAYTPEEVHQDVEIAFAALERRFPNLGVRSSPVQQAVLGAK